MDAISERHELRFDVLRSVRYHQARRRFFIRIHTLVGFMTLLSGSAVVASALSSAGAAAIAAVGCLVAGFSTLDLVVRASEKAAAHHELARRWIDLQKLVDATESPPADAVAHWKNAVSDIERDEPPVLHVLNALMYNEAANAMGLDKGHRLQVHWYQRLLAPVCDVSFGCVKSMSCGN